MGKLLILARYVFLVYGSDIYETRRHIHVTFSHKGFKRACKFWLAPKIELDEKKRGNFSEVELNEIKKLVTEHKDILLKQLELFYSNAPVKAIRK